MLGKFFGLSLLLVCMVLMIMSMHALFLQPSQQESNVLARSTVAKFSSSSSKLISFNSLLDETNSRRSILGRGSLNANEDLSAIAKKRANNMAQKNYFDHQDPDGTHYYNLLNQSQIERGYSCENIALTFDPSPSQVIKEWLSSATHRTCMLDSRLTHIGYGVASYGKITHNNTLKNAYIIVAIHTQQH